MVVAPLSPSWEWPVLDEAEEAMPEGDRQRIYISYITQVLRWWYAHRHDVYVSGNLLILRSRPQSRMPISCGFPARCWV